MTTSSKVRVAVLLALAVSAEALATNTPPTPTPTTPVATATSSAGAGAEADAKAAAIAAQQQAAIAGAAAEGGKGYGGNAAGGAGGNGQGGQGGAGGLGGAGGAGGHSDAEGGDAEATGGEGIGTVEGDTSRFKSLALALNIPAATPAPAVQGVCLTHSRGSAWGWGAFSRTGGTGIDETCATRQQCLAIADRLASWNQIEPAMRQLATCGGVTAEFVPPPPPPAAAVPPVDTSQFVTRPELNEKLDRVFSSGVK